MRRFNLRIGVALFGVGLLFGLLPARPALAQFASLVIAQESVKGGNTAKGTVFRNFLNPVQPAFDVSLSSSDTSVATVPPSVTVPANTAGANFTVTTSPVSATTEVTITGMSGATTHDDTLLVLPYFITDLDVNPASIPSPGTTTITVTIDSPAPPGGMNVNGFLRSFGGTNSLAVPIPGGSTQGSLVVSRSPNIYQVYSVDFTLGGVTIKRELELIPPLNRIVSIPFEPSTLYGGEPTTGQVRLNSLAPPGGATVTLTSQRPDLLMVPGSVHIEEGTTVSDFFPAQSFPVLTCVQVPVTATASFAMNEGMGGAQLIPVRQLTEEPKDFTWSARTPNTSGGKALWTDKTDIFYFDGASATLIQSGSMDVPELGAVEDTVFGLGSGADPGEVIGAWRRGTDFAWVWKSTAAEPVLVSVTHPLDPDEPVNPERLGIAGGCVFFGIQAATGGNNYQYVFKVDPDTGTSERITQDPHPFISTRLATSDCQAAWSSGDDATMETMYFYDGAELHAIDTAGAFEFGDAHLKDGRLVYTKYLGDVPQVFLYDSTVPNPTPEQLTFDATGENTSPQTDGRHVAWIHWPMGVVNKSAWGAKGGDPPADIVLRRGRKFTDDGTPKHIFHLNRGQMIWAYDQTAGEFQYFNGRETKPVCTMAGNNNTFERVWFADGHVPWLGDASVDVDPAKGSQDFQQVFMADLAPPPDDSLPLPPFVLDATPGAGRVFLSWDRILGADNYNVYYAREGGVTPQNYASLDGGNRIEGVAEPFAVSGLIDGATYYFVVTVVDDGVEGSESVEASAQPAPDCNLNGVDDALDIEFNTSPDDNENGVPDECEVTPSPTPTPTTTPGGPTVTPTATNSPGGPTLTFTPTITPGGPSLTPTPTPDESASPTPSCAVELSDFDFDGSFVIDAPDLLALLEEIKAGGGAFNFDCMPPSGTGDLFELARRWRIQLGP